VWYRIDDVTLRDEPDDPDAAWAYVRTLEPGGDKVVWLRMLGELAQAEALGWDLLASHGGPASLASFGGRALPIAAVAPALRLAHVLQWQERFGDADLLFAAAISSAERLAEAAPDGSAEERRALTLLAFGWQHLGKSRFDERRFDEALMLFRRAHELRGRLGAPNDQIASSEQAIAATCARLASRPTSPAD
jgi:tetratricopeptide (TPR) repeat protein